MCRVHKIVANTFGLIAFVITIIFQVFRMDVFAKILGEAAILNLGLWDCSRQFLATSG